MNEDERWLKEHETFEPDFCVGYLWCPRNSYELKADAVQAGQCLFYETCETRMKLEKGMKTLWEQEEED
jgi:hypothetical protein